MDKLISVNWLNEVDIANIGAADAKGLKRGTNVAGGQDHAIIKQIAAELYDKGKATSIASVLEIDAVIDPARTREWILAGLRSVPVPLPLHQRTGRKRPCIDTW